MVGLLGLIFMAAPGVHASATKAVRYAGLRITIPADWPVYDLDRDPARCLRYDQRALYLGTPGPDAECPARMVGRTETIQIERGLPDEATPSVTSFRSVVVPDSADREVRLPVPADGVTVTGTYGEDRALLQRLLRGITVHRSQAVLPQSSRPSRRVAEEDEAAQGPPLPQTMPDLRFGWTAGRGFDTCSAPSLHAMRAWRSAYSVANIYIGGAARACGQPNLSYHWIHAVHRMGYRLIPTYVGLQAPCTGYHDRFTGRNAAAQGGKAADDAVRAAHRLGIPFWQPIYFDMEPYIGGAGCRHAVLTFLDAWSRRLDMRRYLPGVYSTAATGIRDLGRAKRIVKPVVIWFARWDGKATVQGGRYVPAHEWAPHRRIKQYRGDHNERHGGVTLTIDTNAVDGRVF